MDGANETKTTVPVLQVSAAEVEVEVGAAGTELKGSADSEGVGTAALRQVF